jgi:hypothetical protein
MIVKLSLFYQHFVPHVLAGFTLTPNSLLAVFCFGKDIFARRLNGKPPKKQGDKVQERLRHHVLIN